MSQLIPSINTNTISTNGNNSTSNVIAPHLLHMLGKTMSVSEDQLLVAPTNLPQLIDPIRLRDELRLTPSIPIPIQTSILIPQSTNVDNNSPTSTSTSSNASALTASVVNASASSSIRDHSFRSASSAALAHSVAAAAAAAAASANAAGSTVMSSNIANTAHNGSVSGLVAGLRNAGFPKLTRSRANHPTSIKGANDKTVHSTHSHGSSNSSGGGGKSLCLPGCTTYPRCSCRLKSSLKDKIKGKFSFRSFMQATSNLPVGTNSRSHTSITNAAKDARESEHLTAIRMLADLLEDNKICIAEAVSGGVMERMHLCMQVPALQNAALETLGVVLQCWLKFDRSNAHSQLQTAQSQLKGINVAKSACKKQGAHKSLITEAGKKKAGGSATTCSCCSPLTGAGACGTCNACLTGQQMKLETWVQLHSSPTPPPAPAHAITTNTQENITEVDTAVPGTSTTTTAAALDATTAAMSVPATAATALPTPSLTISPSSGTGAAILHTSLKLLRQSSTRKLACFIISHYSSIPAAALLLIHLEGAITTLLDVYQSLSDTKDSQLLVHLSAVMAGLCSKPSKTTIQSLFPMVPILLARFKHCSNSLVVAYICTALGRLCDGQPFVAESILNFNIASYLLFLYYSAVERVRRKEKVKKDLVQVEDVYGLLGLLVFHDQNDVSVLLAAPKVHQQTPFAWSIKQKAGDMHFVYSHPPLPAVTSTSTIVGGAASGTSRSNTPHVDDSSVDVSSETSSMKPLVSEAMEKHAAAMAGNGDDEPDASAASLQGNALTSVDPHGASMAVSVVGAAAAPSIVSAAVTVSDAASASTSVVKSASPNKLPSKPNLDLADIISQIFDLVPPGQLLDVMDEMSDVWYYVQRACWQISMILRSGSAPHTRVQRLIDGQVIDKLLHLMSTRLNEMPAASLCEAGQALAYTILAAKSPPDLNGLGLTGQQPSAAAVAATAAAAAQMARLIHAGALRILLVVLNHPKCSARCSLAIVDAIAAILAIGIKERAIVLRRTREKVEQSVHRLASQPASTLKDADVKGGKLASSIHPVASDMGSEDESMQSTDEDFFDELEHAEDVCSDSEEDACSSERRHQRKVQRRVRMKKQCTDSIRTVEAQLSETDINGTTASATSASSLTPSSSTYRTHTESTSASALSSSLPLSVTTISRASSGMSGSPTAKSKRKASTEREDPYARRLPSRSDTPISQTRPSQQLAAAGPASEELIMLLTQAHVTPSASNTAAGVVVDSSTTIVGPMDTAEPAPPKRSQFRARRSSNLAEIKPPAPFVATEAMLSAAAIGAIALSAAAEAAAVAAVVTEPTVQVNNSALDATAVITDASTKSLPAVESAFNLPTPLVPDIPAIKQPAGYWFTYPAFNGYAGLLLMEGAHPILTRVRAQNASKNGKEDKTLKSALDSVLAQFANPVLLPSSIFDSPYTGSDWPAIQSSAEIDLVQTWKDIVASHNESTLSIGVVSVTDPNHQGPSVSKGMFLPRVPPPLRVHFARMTSARQAQKETDRITTQRRKQIRQALAWAAISGPNKPRALTPLTTAGTTASATSTPPHLTARKPSSAIEPIPQVASDVETDEDIGNEEEKSGTAASAIPLDPAAAASEAERLAEAKKKKLRLKREARKKKEAARKAANRELNDALAMQEAARTQKRLELEAEKSLLEEQLAMAIAERAVFVAKLDQMRNAENAADANAVAAARKALPEALQQKIDAVIAAATSAHPAPASATAAVAPNSKKTTDTGAAGATSKSKQKEPKERIAPPVIAKCRNHAGVCSSAPHLITGFEEYAEVVCTESCLIHYHYALPSREHSCFVQACAAEEEAAQGKFSVREQITKFGGPQFVDLNILPVVQGEDIVSVSLPPLPTAEIAMAEFVAAAASRKPLQRNSPCLTPDCPGKISSVLVKSGRGNQMKLLKVLVQFREMNLRRDREREREIKKARQAADQLRAAAEQEEREKQLQQRLAARAIQLQAEEEKRERLALIEREKEKERERESAEKRQLGLEREKVRERERAAAKEAAVAAAAASAAAAAAATPIKREPIITVALKASPKPPIVSIAVNTVASPTPTSVSAVSISPAVITGRSQVRSSAPPFRPASSTNASSSPVQQIQSNNLTPIPPSNWAALMGGGTAPAASVTNMSTANVTAATKSLSRKEKKKNKGPLNSFDTATSMVRADMMLTGLVRCRGTVPTPFLYVQHFSSIQDVQTICTQFGLHCITSCFAPVALLVEFDSIEQSSACYDALNAMYFARYADDPLMVLLDGESEATPVLIPPLMPFMLYANQQLSKREKAKAKRQEAIAASKEERMKKKIGDRIGRAGIGGGVSGLSAGGGESPFDQEYESPDLLSTLSLNDDDAFPSLEAAAASSHVHGQRESSEGEKRGGSPLRAFLPTPLFDSPTHNSSIEDASAPNSTESTDELSSLPATDSTDTTAADAPMGDEGRGAYRNLFSIFARTPSTSSKPEVLARGSAETQEQEPALFSLAHAHSLSATQHQDLSLISSTFLSAACPPSAAPAGVTDTKLFASSTPSWSMFEPASSAFSDNMDASVSMDAEWPSSSSTNSLTWLPVNSTSAAVSSPFHSMFDSGGATLVTSADSPSLSPDAPLLGSGDADEFGDADVGYLDDADGGWQIGDQQTELALPNAPTPLNLTHHSNQSVSGDWSSLRNHAIEWNITHAHMDSGESGSGGMRNGSLFSDAREEQSVLPAPSTIRSFLERSFANTSPSDSIGGSAATSPPPSSASPDNSGRTTGGNSTVNINVSVQLNVNITNVHLTTLHASPPPTAPFNRTSPSTTTSPTHGTGDNAPSAASSGIKEPINMAHAGVWHVGNLSQTVTGSTSATRNADGVHESTSIPVSASAPVYGQSGGGVVYSHSTSKGSPSPHLSSSNTETADSSWEVVGKSSHKSTRHTYRTAH
jgi:hypothetical protein